MFVLFQQKTEYERGVRIVGSEMGIRDRYRRDTDANRVLTGFRQRQTDRNEVAGRLRVDGKQCR